jgi:hypothetical protein
MKNLKELKVIWNETNEKLKQRFSILTDNDVFMEGKKDKIISHLQFKLVKTKEDMYKLISEL